MWNNFRNELTRFATTRYVLATALLLTVCFNAGCDMPFKALKTEYPPLKALNGEYPESLVGTWTPTWNTGDSLVFYEDKTVSPSARGTQWSTYSISNHLGQESAQILKIGDCCIDDDITEVRILLRDDSPEDLEGGAALFQEEIIITTKAGQRFSNRRRLKNQDGSESPILEYTPVIEGGFQKEGFRTADGRETITLRYELDGPEYKFANGPPPADTEKLEFRLVVANDYCVEVLLDGRYSYAEYLPVLQAPKNVKDGSNKRYLNFEVSNPAIYGYSKKGKTLKLFYGNDKEFTSTYVRSETLRR